MTSKTLFALRLCLLGLALIGLVVLARIPINAAASPSAISADGPWQDIDEAAIPGPAERWIVPQNYRTLRLNEPALLETLGLTAMENTPEARLSPQEISLPMPDGSYQRFQVVKVELMAPELAALYPQITTYRAVGVDDPTAFAIIDHTPAGFHAMILAPGGTIFIDPYRKADTLHYISYFRRDYLLPQGKSFVEQEPLGDPEKIGSLVEQLGPEAVSGDTLRTYRTAIAATGEYTIFHGGTVANGLAAIVTSLNRVSGVYEREVAVRLVLIANNNLIIYTNPATDPYTNDSGFAMLAENQANTDAVIGNANYDIGHVFSTGNGGVAYLGVPCRAGMKAGGVTGSSSPVGVGFDINYVAHEMGHQFGANHTFNSVTGACGGGNRNEDTAYEPGSGTTIMSYAGVCGVDNLQGYHDDDFHTISFDEIIAYTTIGDGNTCAVQTLTGNQPPTVEAGTGGFTIPVGTPFTLTGSGSDPDGDPLLYSWEEFDLGPAGSPNSPSGDAPIFRSFSPVSSASRTFPKMSDIVNNVHTIGELLPTYTRSLTFRLTARDNHIQPSADGVAYDTIAFSVSDLAGPFVVTAPNTDVIWLGYELHTITWNVADTQAAPVSCSTVNLALSTDGGYTYPISLISATPNDGSETIIVPNLATTTARVRVACATNIFFDISNANFTIQLNANPPAAFGKTSPSNNATGVSVNPTLFWEASSGATGYEYCLDVSDNDTCDSAWISVTLNTSAIVSGLMSNTSYFWQVRAANPNGSTYADSDTWWDFTTLAAAPAAFGKISPENDASGVSISLTLAWESSSGASGYEYCLDTSDNAICDSAWISASTQISVTFSGLDYATLYSWQVRAANNAGITDSNEDIWWNFTTQIAPPAAFGKISPADGASGVSFGPMISWESSAGAASYEYCYDTTDNDTCDGSWIGSGTNVSATLSSLDSGIPYYWQVRAINTSGTVYASSESWWHFTTQWRLYLPVVNR